MDRGTPMPRRMSTAGPCPDAQKCAQVPSSTCQRNYGFLCAIFTDLRSQAVFGCLNDMGITADRDQQKPFPHPRGTGRHWHCQTGTGKTLAFAPCDDAVPCQAKAPEPSHSRQRTCLQIADVAKRLAARTDLRVESLRRWTPGSKSARGRRRFAGGHGGGSWSSTCVRPSTPSPFPTSGLMTDRMMDLGFMPAPKASGDFAHETAESVVLGDLPSKDGGHGRRVPALAYAGRSLSPEHPRGNGDPERISCRQLWNQAEPAGALAFARGSRRPSPAVCPGKGPG